MIPVKFKLADPTINTKLPEYATFGSSGADVRAAIFHPIKIYSMERVTVPTNLMVEIARGFEIQIRPRSGMAITHGITVINSPGTIDSDFRGEILVGLINLSKYAYTIEPGAKIAQMVLCPVYQIDWNNSPLSNTERGTNGFGSTGVL